MNDDNSSARQSRTFWLIVIAHQNYFLSRAFSSPPPLPTRFDSCDFHWSRLLISAALSAGVVRSIPQVSNPPIAWHSPFKNRFVAIPRVHSSYPSGMVMERQEQNEKETNRPSNSCTAVDSTFECRFRIDNHQIVCCCSCRRRCCCWR